MWWRKNALTWTNLGLLYLHQKDLELANQALFRAQTLDPECTIAWVGQALVATANGHHSDSTTLFEHAVTLASVVVSSVSDVSRTSPYISSLRQIWSSRHGRLRD